MSALLALLLAASQAASPTEPEFCFASNTPTCRVRRVARQARVYSLPSLDRLRRQGVTARRVSFFDQNDHDVAAIILSRRRGGRPLLTVLRPGGGTPDPAISVALTDAVWRELLAASRRFDVPEPSDGQTVCFDSWLVHVEAVDPGRAPREALRTTCPGGVAVTYGYWLAHRAVRLLPDCRLLEDRFFAGDITRLNYCTRMSGDRPVAARAANAAFALSMLDLPRDREEVPPYFAEDAVLDWNGEQAAGRSAVAARLLLGFTEREGLFYRVEQFAGHADGSADVEGALSAYVRDDDDERLGYRIDTAPMTLHLRREADGRFLVTQMRVGPFTRRVIGRPSR